MQNEVEHVEVSEARSGSPSLPRSRDAMRISVTERLAQLKAMRASAVKQRVASADAAAVFRLEGNIGALEWVLRDVLS